MGRFIREQLIREGVDVRGVKTDKERLTALVLLGIRDQNQFPLIFYRENCADMALCEDDIESSLKGMLKPEYEEVQSGVAEIREIFRSSKVG